MRARITIALLGLLLAAAPAARGQDAANDMRHLRARNQRLKAALADSQKRIEELERRLDEVATAVGKLRWDASMVKAGLAAAVADTGRVHELDIRVVAGGWGDEVVLADIQKVLESAGGELWQFFPNRKLPPIIVKHGNNGPIALFKKGPNGEHIVQLDVEGRHWSQFAYQFAHELCHILTNYHPAESKKNKWFIESLCETASIYALRRMAESWKTSPPYPNWASFAHHHREYADDVHVKKELRLAPGATLGPWYRKNAAILRKQATLRETNKVPASALLSLLEADPAAWNAIGSLNLSIPDKDDTFEDFLGDWHTRAPVRGKAFVKKVVDLFEIKLPAKPAKPAGK